MQNKDSITDLSEVKARLMSLINNHWDNCDETLPEIKECLRALHDDILDNHVVDGYLVENRLPSFRERIDDITWLNATSYVYRNNNETTLYFFRTSDSSLVCTIDEEYLTDIDIYRENQTQQILTVLADEIEYFNEEEEWLISDIKDLANELHNKTVKLSDMQRGKLLVQNAISKCNDFFEINFECNDE